MIPTPASEMIEVGVAPAKSPVLQKRVVFNQLTLAQNEIRNLVGLLERAHVVADIVIGGKRQHHHVRRILPDVISQRNQLLRGAVT